MEISKRRLGRTGFEISEIGFGAWAIGGKGYGSVEEADAAGSLETYLESGGNFIDTARGYGMSEELIGKVLSKRRHLNEKVILATKSGNSRSVETIPGIRKDLELSLRLLNRDYIDLYYLHNPPDDPAVMYQVLEEYGKLKEEGKILAIGASIKGPDVTSETVSLCSQYIATGMVDAIQVIYSIFRQKTAEIFEEAFHNGVGIVARTVLENGFLTGKYSPGYQFPEDDHRRRWGSRKLDEILESSIRLQAFAVRPPYESMVQTAISFALDSKYVSSTIVGAKSEKQVRSNLALAALPSLDPSLVAELKRHYQGRTESFNTGEGE